MINKSFNPIYIYIYIYINWNKFINPHIITKMESNGLEDLKSMTKFMKFRDWIYYCVLQYWHPTPSKLMKSHVWKHSPRVQRRCHMFRSIRSHIFYFMSFHATLNAIVAIGDPPPFDPLEHFFPNLGGGVWGHSQKSNVENPRSSKVENPLGWNKNNFVFGVEWISKEFKNRESYLNFNFMPFSLYYP